MSAKEQIYENPPRVGDYPRIPDHSDLRGFSYRAPTAFDYRDENKKKSGTWSRLLAMLGFRKATS